MRVLLSILLLCCLPASISAGEAAAARGDDVFDKQVRPLLAAHCIDCHGGKQTKAGLNLTSRESVLRGADSGPVLVAGHANQSVIVQVTGADADPHMPPKKQLSEAEIATLTRWIDGMSAAPAVADASAAKAIAHWAFKKPASQRPPAVKDAAWVRNPIDAFILARLEKEGLKPSPPADRATLIRRVTFDLTGLPPTPEQVKDFIADQSPDAYERVIDRLLASPAYGERWGRHWLDLARYADSGGFHNDLDRPNAWRYRDYVIRAFNEDKPYGQFIREQIAGDEVDPASVDAVVATGFGRNGPSNDDNVGKTAADREKYRLDELDDVISTTSTVFLGLTIGCARCHDHKYDPLPQTDYYRLLAVFDNTVKKDLPLTDDGKSLLATRSTSRVKEPTKAPAAMALVETSATPRTTRLLWRGDFNKPGPVVEPGPPVVLTSSPVTFPAPAAGVKNLGRRRVLADWIASPENPLTWRVIANRVWQHHFGRGIVGTPSNFGVSGDRPTHPELLDWLAEQLAAGGGRIKPLHKLILMSSAYQQSSQPNADAAAVDPEDTLLWRMPKRRLEAEATRDAVLAVAGTLNPAVGGPGIKPRLPADVLQASQRNKWPTVVREGPEHWRRSVYIYMKRQLQVPMLELLDAPSASQSCDRRSTSILPTQALVLMNDEFMSDQATHFADRVLREAGNGEDARKLAERAMWIALSKPPAEARATDAVKFIEQQTKAQIEAGKTERESQREALIDLCHVLFNTNEFVYVE